MVIVLFRQIFRCINWMCRVEADLDRTSKIKPAYSDWLRRLKSLGTAANDYRIAFAARWRSIVDANFYRRIYQ